MADSRESFAVDEKGDPGSPVSERSCAEAIPVTPSDSSGVSGDTTNPFEVDPGNLTQTCSSPSMFLSRSPATPELDRSFRWSIEQMSALWPVDIDEHELSHQQADGSDTVYEQRCQEAVDVFFSQNEIVPSPQGSVEESSSLPAGGSNGGPGQTTTATVGTQSVRSAPPDNDLLRVLLKYHASRVAHGTQGTAAAPSAWRLSAPGQLVCSNVAVERAQTPDRSKTECSLPSDAAMESPPASDGPQHSTPIGPLEPEPHWSLSPIGLESHWSRPANPERESAQRSPARRQDREQLEGQHSRMQVDSSAGELTCEESTIEISDPTMPTAPESSGDMLPTASHSPR